MQRDEKRVKRLFLISMSIISLTAPWSRGEEALAELSAEEVKLGFSSLFNGKDLTGWKEVQGAPGTFKVVDGVLVGARPKGKFTAYWLSTNEKYGDFQLRLEYMLPPDGNSGIFIRVPSPKGRTSMVGMEIQLLDDGKKTGKPGVGDTGAVYRVVAPSEYVARPANAWNDLEITCEGDLIRVRLNGKLINEADMSKYDALKNRPREGYIGLSSHTHDVKFRNVRLRKLPNKSPSPAEK